MGDAPTIRPATPGDVPTIEAIAVAAGMFGADEVEFLGAQFRATAADPASQGQWRVIESAGAVRGAAYWAPEPLADRMWNLYFIAVDPAYHGRGLGKRLMAHAESSLRAVGAGIARTLIVETSSTDQYAGTRAFYRRLGYDEEATVREYYGPGDGKVIFWKSLVA